MTLLRNVVRVTHDILSSKRCFVLGTNSSIADKYFGSKIEIPPPPKRPLTAYMIFCKENRKELLKENPSLSSPEQIKILAQKWGHLTAEMKKPYELDARLSTQRYGVEHKKFYESLTEAQKEELARLKAKRLESRRISRYKKVLQDSGFPKAPHSGYILFLQSESKKKHSVKPAPEFIKEAAELWKSLPEDSKNIYEKQAEKDKMRYMEEMKKWRAKVLADGDKKVLKAYEELKGKGKSLDSDEESNKKEMRAVKKKLAKEKSKA